MTMAEDDDWIGEALSISEPRAFLYHDFLSREECEHVIELAKPHLKRSEVINKSTEKNTVSTSRTSYGTFLRRGQDETIRNIEKRIADITSIPVERGEGLHVLYYEVGQKFDPHFDYSDDNEAFNKDGGGGRVATLVMYLSDVELGGQTVFPSAKPKPLSVKPKVGDALLFWSMKPDGTRDECSLHSASPVIKGNKWASTKWMRVRQF